MFTLLAGLVGAGAAVYGGENQKRLTGKALKASKHDAYVSQNFFDSALNVAVIGGGLFFIVYALSR